MSTSNNDLDAIMDAVHRRPETPEPDIESYEDERSALEAVLHGSEIVALSYLEEMTPGELRRLNDACYALHDLIEHEQRRRRENNITVNEGK